MTTLTTQTISWHTKVEHLKGVGPKLANTLFKYHIETVGDLLLHCPIKYQDRTHITPIQDVRANDFVVIQGQVVSKNLQYGKKKRLVVKLTDGSGVINVTFFYYAQQLNTKWVVGSTWRCFGQVSFFQNKFALVHPETQPILGDENQSLEQSLTPIYPNIQGISQLGLRKLIQTALDAFVLSQTKLDDPFYAHCRDYPFIPIEQAVKSIHCPNPEVSVNHLNEKQFVGAQRLIAEELYAHYLVLQKMRAQYHQRQGITFKKVEGLEAFISSFPFRLTSGQRQCIEAIEKDVAKVSPMYRLVQGDVGSGKTVVAAAATLMAVANGYQVALMAPTEILAEQLADHFSDWFAPLKYRVATLTGKLKSAQRRSIQENVLLGLDNIIVGTHALFQEKFAFKKLGLMIIDEQHRFGVSQRLSLQRRGTQSLETAHPHQLIMTATPIPRTLAISQYAHMDISIIDTLPSGRLPIQTFVIANTKRQQVLERIRERIKMGQQIYWVCTLIDESETLNCEAAEKTYEHLQAHFKEECIGLVHGRLSAEQKASVMQAFKEGKLSLLVATTVIEVGVNVPNATLMIIENAERLGLAQLHQLRGRVGRSHLQSHCILMYQGKLSENAKARLNIMRQTNDGFKIAEADLKIRGPGEFLGVKQTGLAQYKIADLIRDGEWVSKLPALDHKLRKLTQAQKETIIARWVGNKDIFALV